jgi:hypothetical protein
MKGRLFMLTLVLVMANPVQLMGQSSTGRKIGKATKDAERTENTIEKGKELMNKIFKKKNKGDENEEDSDSEGSNTPVSSKNREKGSGKGSESPYFMEFTIGEEYFLLDAYNDPDWLGLHAEKDRENEYLSYLSINALKTGYLNKKGKTGAINFVMAPKDRNIKNQTYSFQKGEDAYNPLISFYFALGDTNYYSSKPVFITIDSTQSYVHTMGGYITIVRNENTKDGIVEGSFRMEGITIERNKKLVSEGNVAEGKFRMPISIGQRMSN